MSAGSTLWHGRFEGGPAEALMAYTVSLPFDRRLGPQDVRGSRAHVAGLVRAGLMSAEDGELVRVALEQVESELLAGTLEFLPSDEDIHTAVERRVTELAGEAGARLHTARSRNDQVATDLRLWTREALLDVVDGVLALQGVLASRAGESFDITLPGYTHLQRAQSVSLAHHLMAHAWALSRDVDRLLSTIERADVSPLGAGALAGTSLPIDPEFTARELGFSSVFENSLDAVGDRDFVAEALFDLALLGVHLSRIGEEWVLWTSEEFGFAVLDDGYATGSSMLPQKKNADIAELARGKSGRLIGHLTGLLATLKGLPLAYNRDLQEDKEPLFDAVDQVVLALAAVGGMLATARFVPEAMERASGAEVLAATDLAEFLVRSGRPFREAHATVGALVRRHLAGEGSLADIASDSLGEEVRAVFGGRNGAAMRTSRGGGSPSAARDQHVRLLARLSDDQSRRDRWTG